MSAIGFMPARGLFMEHFTFIDIDVVDVIGTRVNRNVLLEQEVRRNFLRILESSRLCSIATVTPEGRAHINTAFFSYSEQLELYFWSHPESLHCRNLLSNSSMAMAVFSTEQPWIGPGEGIQLFGTGKMTSNSTAEEAERSYRRRFPDYENWKGALQPDDLAHQYRFYRFEVDTVKILDEKNWDDVWVRATVLRQ
jgi:uncharacterized protein YhbP (UPF0306 family)